MNKEFELNEAIEFINNVYQHKFDDMEEIKKDGTQVIYIDKLNDIKFSDFESASFTLLRGYGILEYKYKELHNKIDKAIEFIKELDKECEKEGCSFVNLIEVLKIIEILKDSDVDE